MGKLGSAMKKIYDLENKLGEGREWKSVRAIDWLSWRVNPSRVMRTSGNERPILSINVLALKLTPMNLLSCRLGIEDGSKSRLVESLYTGAKLSLYTCIITNEVSVTRCKYRPLAVCYRRSKQYLGRFHRHTTDGRNFALVEFLYEDEKGLNIVETLGGNQEMTAIIHVSHTLLYPFALLNQKRP
jgi:hypothetical protein